MQGNTVYDDLFDHPSDDSGITRIKTAQLQTAGTYSYAIQRNW